MHDETRRQTHASSPSPIHGEARGNVEKIVSADEEEVEEEDGEGGTFCLRPVKKE